MVERVGLILAIVAGIAWGVYLLPSRRAPDLPSFIMFSSLFIFLGSSAYALTAGTSLKFDLPTIGLSLFAGVLWTVGFVAATLAVSHLGLGVGYSLWSGVQVIIAIAVGVLFYREMLDAPFNLQLVLLVAMSLIIAGVFLTGYVQSQLKT